MPAQDLIEWPLKEKEEDAIVPWRRCWWLLMYVNH